MPIQFIESTHTYILKDQELLSTTEFISQFFEKFDEERWSKYVADRDGLSVQEVLDKWERNRQYACDFGTNVHAYAEALINKDEPPEPIDDKSEAYFRIVDMFFEHAQLDFIEAEKIIGSAAWGIGGTVDGIAKNGKGIYLVDWKTNKRIEKEGYRDKRCLYPLNHLQDCNFSKYSLQLSLYRHMLEEHYDMPVVGQILVHLTKEGYHIHRPKYLKKEVRMMLEHTGRL